jgi:hypothetical protein
MTKHFITFFSSHAHPVVLVVQVAGVGLKVKCLEGADELRVVLQTSVWRSGKSFLLVGKVGKNVILGWNATYVSG